MDPDDFDNSADYYRAKVGLHRLSQRQLKTKVQKIEIVGNDRISSETITMFSQVNIGDDLNDNDVNKVWAKKLGIPQSAAITCVKPSGTVSQLVDSASGIHTRHSPYYLRTVRADKKDPLARMMVDAGVYHEDDLTKPEPLQ